MSRSRVFVLVQDVRSRPVKGSVTLHFPGKARPQRIAYDERLERYVASDLEPGAYEIRVKGPKGTSEERRVIELAPGDNHTSVMVAKPGLSAIETPQGRSYLDLRFTERLLHVQGEGALSAATAALRKQKLSAERVTPRHGAPDDDVLFRVVLGRGEQARRREKALSQVVEEQLGGRVQARVSVPAYVDSEISVGLTDEIVVRFVSSAMSAQIAALARRYGLTQIRQIAWLGNGFLFRYPEAPSKKLLDVVSDLNGEALVVFAEPNFTNRLENYVYTPADYLYPETQHLPLMNADDAWDTVQTTTTVHRGGSPDVVVAVLDIHGVDPTHPDLTGTLSDGTAKQIANFNFATMANQTFAGLAGDHGTQCAGSATGRFDNVVGSVGVAPNCKLIGGRFSGFATDLQIADIWVWMAGFPTSSTLAGFPAQLSKGADIISNSWGPTAPKATNQTLRAAFDYLATYPRNGRGVIMVFATGNLGYTLVDTFNPYSADAKTLAVGASINTGPTNPVNSVQADHQGNFNNLPAAVDTRAYYSPYGLTIDIVSPSHTCYGPGLPGAGIVDPIMAPSRTGLGDWPSSAVSSTTLTAGVAAGATVLPVASTLGFAVGAVVLLGAPGSVGAETRTVTAVGGGNLTVAATANAHPAATVVATGAADYAMNASIGFGGTSHSCPTVAGAAALLLSVRPDLNWVEVRQILRDSAVQIDAAQPFATGQWVDLDGDTVPDYSQWYGYGRLDVDAAVTAAIALILRSDVVTRDNLTDSGAVPSAGWHAASPDIWVRRTNDPIPALAYGSNPPHENAQFGQDNWIYARVRNNGTAAAPVVYVRAMLTHFAGIEFVYPDDWEPTPRFGTTPLTPLEPGTYLIGESTLTNLAPGAAIIQKLTWSQALVPPETVTVLGSPVKWHPCLLVEASPHDGPAVISGLAYPVKGDNNIAHRNISIDYPGMGGSAGLMNAVIAGTRTPSGVDRLIIDRTAVPADVGVLVRAEATVMRHWIDLTRSGTAIVRTEPLGTERGGRSTPGSGEPSRPCEVTLLDPARLSIACCGRGSIVVHAPAQTRLSLDCGPTDAMRDVLTVQQHQGQTVLRVAHGAGAVSLPLRLGPGQWSPVLVGADAPNSSAVPRGRILLSQLRGDGEVSAGYEIDI
jgi:hypothetical protein